jgi:hypothetical protein
MNGCLNCLQIGIERGLFVISIKQYAEERGKSIQAVHQQRKRKKYKARLEGHVIEKDGVYYLDKEAVKILDSAHETTVQVVDTNSKRRIQELENQLQKEKNRTTNLLSEIKNKSNKFEDLQAKLQAQTEQMAALVLDNKEKTLLLEQKEDQAAKVDKLITENAELKAKIELLEKSNDQLSAKVASQSVSESQNEPKKGFFARLFGK